MLVCHLIGICLNEVIYFGWFYGMLLDRCNFNEIIVANLYVVNVLCIKYREI